MEKTELFAYLRGQCLGVLGTLSRDNEPQGALVGYAVTSDLEILFDTVRTSRKYGNMIANPRVSFTVGNTVGKGDERTVQYEGIAEELAGESLARFQELSSADPENLEARRDVANLNREIGDVLAEAGQASDGAEFSRKALGVYEELQRADPTNSENAGNIADVRARIAAVEAKRRPSIRPRRTLRPAHIE